MIEEGNKRTVQLTKKDAERWVGGVLANTSNTSGGVASRLERWRLVSLSPPCPLRRRRRRRRCFCCRRRPSPGYYTLSRSFEKRMRSGWNGEGWDEKRIDASKTARTTTTSTASVCVYLVIGYTDQWQSGNGVGGGSLSFRRFSRISSLFYILFFFISSFSTSLSLSRVGSSLFHGPVPPLFRSVRLYPLSIDLHIDEIVPIDLFLPPCLSGAGVWRRLYDEAKNVCDWWWRWASFFSLQFGYWTLFLL